MKEGIGVKWAGRKLTKGVHANARGGQSGRGDSGFILNRGQIDP